MSIPRPEYPRPQYVRETWLNLNGCWEFALDPGCSGRARGLAAAEKLEQKIIVPFCPESSLSGVGIIDFMPAVWYRREVEIPAEWAGQRILLHFGAVDYASEMWVNGVSAGTHRGGYSSFTFEITSLLQAGINVITVCAEDDTRSQLQPSGKQSELYASAGCHYTRTTGIWQTVWLEAVPATYLDRPFISANLENGAFELAIPLIGEQRDLSLQIQASFAGLQVGTVTVFPCGQQFYAHLPLFSIHPWSPQQPSLYDLILTLRDAAGNIIDRITSYAGLRSITLAPPKVLINNRAIFQRLVLDQGYYPDGIYTAPSDDALRGDIEIAQAMGFNGARLHQKVFEERFLYWADKLGYLVWGEMANWGLDLAHPLAQERFQSEWCEVLARDFNHPCIIGWCPFNETQSNQNPEVLRQIYRLTKQLDPTRPVIDTSGWVHVESDIYDVHDYQQDPTLFAQSYTGELPTTSVPNNALHISDPQQPAAQLYFISEYGGIWWSTGQAAENNWGYGDRPQSVAEFLARYRDLTEPLLRHPGIFASCYTQLCDVEQEVNGLYTCDRQAKFDPEIIKSINEQTAAIEE